MNGLTKRGPKAREAAPRAAQIWHHLLDERRSRAAQDVGLA
jgi:hypothetical protein